ncbi:hypothetical protein [Luteipulveratus mongoliensis]|uniref:Lipoprotein n=1 Tax=Luteipulveratus mongoliensis TaxID=571913 RepID=A0A0K1JF67_9MICO|nr:hypothetical protein [Luteipulveratus mongoliensis]AKU15230.1 hypothetical protein VV02_04060 [Luteipulveratus mongoliensis]
MSRTSNRLKSALAISALSASVLLGAGCSDDGGPVSREMWIDAYWIDASGQQLTAEVTGGIDERIGTLNVVENSATVQVTATLVDDDGGKYDVKVGFPLRDRVQLESPLGARKVVSPGGAGVVRRTGNPPAGRVTAGPTELGGALQTVMP